MAISIGDNFHYQGTSPNFARDSFDTLAAMSTFAETSLDEGHVSFCKEDGNRYQYKSTNSVDATTGKWRSVSIDPLSEAIFGITSDLVVSNTFTWSSATTTYFKLYIDISAGETFTLTVNTDPSKIGTTVFYMYSQEYALNTTHTIKFDQDYTELAIGFGGTSFVEETTFEITAEKVETVVEGLSDAVFGVTSSLVVSDTFAWDSAVTKYFKLYINISAGEPFTLTVNTDPSKIGTTEFFMYSKIYELNTTHTIVFDEDQTELAIGFGSTSFVEATTFEITAEKTEYLTKSLSARVEDLENAIDDSAYPQIILTDNLYCVVGDTVQLFFNSITTGLTEANELHISCTHGKNYPRYWEYTPTSSNVGEVTMTVEIIEVVTGNVLATKDVSVVTVAASNPASSTNILLIGDSLVAAGEQAIELSRRLKGTTGVATTPTALSMSNYILTGRISDDDYNGIGWEGTGGYTWSDYTTEGSTAVRLQVSNVTDVRMLGTYYYAPSDWTGDSDDPTSSYDLLVLQIEEINVTDGTGNIRCSVWRDTTLVDELSSSGTLVAFRPSDGGQTSLSYTSYEVESYSPFWDVDTDSFDISSYIDTYCGGHLEYICLLLGVNSVISSNPHADFSSVLSAAKTFCELVHDQEPDIKILLATLPLPSQKGGIGTSYGASDNSGSYLTRLWNYKIHQVNRLYKTLEEDGDLSGYLFPVNLAAQFDAENNYPSTSKVVNSRSTTTETMQTNSVHPNNDGYWQMADVWFRSIIGIDD
ncbi:MAG: hypothetical protein SNJ31_05430 [Rikenellaceae bacterium]